MKRLIAAFSTTALVLLLAGCSEAPASYDNHDADIKALKDNEAQWNKDFEAKDVDKFVAHYTDDAVLMNPGMPAANGKDAIRKAMKDAFTDPAFGGKFQAATV